MPRKYWNALRSSCVTPSPSAYMRPSFHCASAWPFSAAYSSEWTALAFSPAFSKCAPDLKASIADNGGAAAIASLDLLPSNAMATCAANRPAPITTARNRNLDIRIARLLARPAGMGDRAFDGRPYLLSVFPQITGAEFGLTRLPLGLALGQFVGRKLDIDGALLGIELDDVAVADERDRPADRRLRPNMADAKAAGGAGKAPVGDERDLVALALAIERGRGGKHFTHAGAALRPFVTDHQNVAVLILLVLDRIEAGFLAVETARRSAELERRRHAGDFHDRAFGGKIAFHADHTAGRQQRLICRAHHVLVRVPFHALHVLGDGAAGDGQAIAVQIAVGEQCLHQIRHAPSLEHILGDITAARFQIRDIRCLFEDFGDVEQIELDAAFMRDRRQMQRGIGRAAGGGDDGGGILQRLAGDDVAW